MMILAIIIVIYAAALLIADIISKKKINYFILFMLLLPAQFFFNIQYTYFMRFNCFNLNDLKIVSEAVHFLNDFYVFLAVNCVQFFLFAAFVFTAYKSLSIYKVLTFAKGKTVSVCKRCRDYVRECAYSFTFTLPNLKMTN